MPLPEKDRRVAPFCASHIEFSNKLAVIHSFSGWILKGLVIVIPMCLFSIGQQAVVSYKVDQSLDSIKEIRVDLRAMSKTSKLQESADAGRDFMRQAKLQCKSGQASVD